MSKKEENNIIHIIKNLRDEMKTIHNTLRDEIKTVHNTLRDEIKNVRDEIKTVHNTLRDEIKSIRNDMKWFMGIMISAIVLVSIAIVGGLGWVHNYHLNKNNQMHIEIVKNKIEIEKNKQSIDSGIK